MTFGDGSPLTPDDIVATMKFHHDPDSGSQLAAFYSSVASVEASGPAEVTVKLKSPNVQFRYTAAHMAGFIFKKSQLEEHPKDIGTPEVLPLGTGPYKLVEFAPGDHAVLEANPTTIGGRSRWPSRSPSRRSPIARPGCSRCRTAISTAPSTSPFPTSTSGRR